MKSPDAKPSLPTIAFIGGGNMARSLIGGLLQAGATANQVHVAEPVAELRDALARDFNVHVFSDAASAATHAEVWVLAVKPQVLREVCTVLAPVAQANQPLVVSIAAGITGAQIGRWLGGGIAVVRCMPNTPALLGAGVTGLHANSTVNAEQRDIAQTLLTSAGKTVWVDDESLMDAVTGVSGSGPAYVFLLAEALQAAGEAEGLPADAARTLTIETLLGASRMLAADDTPAAELRRRVTSPNGTTQAAIESFEADGFREVVARAVHAARIRGAELAAAND
ncbi:pyrroline-5-carboxylate reductase [Solilutibacter tolerans]|uniref:Pyrroline-5-carboxylate reductase n=1 Tax=Solilutibacter tolerans TaxID=1604334 RepID=A0A1N6U0U9_9GAMM|nr:pyrroline-5-carboxylate reductase [Lysobacter tolerans]SIQ59268.1 pyrroline-5-carboxylate reductase [Lysobacter tolerans]